MENFRTYIAILHFHSVSQETQIFKSRAHAFLNNQISADAIFFIRAENIIIKRYDRLANHKEMTGAAHDKG